MFVYNFSFFERIPIEKITICWCRPAILPVHAVFTNQETFFSSPEWSGIAIQKDLLSVRKHLKGFPDFVHPFLRNGFSILEIAIHVFVTNLTDFLSDNLFRRRFHL